jgi:putative peptidoglycan lipid II flippase
VTEPEAGGGAHKLVRSSAVVGLGTALSRITGFLRVSALAALGFARLTDVYNIANSTPNIVYELLLGGILTATLVPIYVEHYEKDDQRATDAINTVAIAALAAISVLGFLLAPWIIDLYMVRLSGAGKAAQQALATDLLRWFMPQIFFYGVTALATAMLNARRRFAAAAFAPVLNNVVVICVLLALPRVASAPPTVTSVLDDPALVLLLGLGTTAGIVAMALVLLPALRHAGARLHFVWEWRHPAVAHLARLSGWTFGYVATNQLAFWVALFLAYGHSGDASIYLAAFTFFQLPHGLFAVSIMTALAPELASRASRRDYDGFRAQFAMGFRLMGLVVLPASAILFVLARPIVNALLDYGSFTARDGAATADTLAMFAIGLFAFSTYLFTLRGFYSMQDTRTPFLLNCLENGINIVLAFALYPVMGVEGLALSWSIAYIVATVVALRAMRHRLQRLEGRAILQTFVRVGIATLLLAGIAWLVATVIGYDTPVRAIAATTAALALGGTVFYLALRAMHVRELTDLTSAIRRRPLAA